MKMVPFVRFSVVIVVLFRTVEGQGIKYCGNYIGARIRDYDYQFASGGTIDTSLSAIEDPTSYTKMEIILDRSYYSTTCECGMVTMWQFYAWHPGYIVFFVLDTNMKVVGKSSFYVGTQSQFNFFEIPLSSDMWIPIRENYYIGFWSNGDGGEPMITYQQVGAGTYAHSYKLNVASERNVNEIVTTAGYGTFSNKRYAVAAYVVKAHAPMFVNAPFTTTLYTHQTSSTTPIYTASVLDLDGVDQLTVTKTSVDSYFQFLSGSLYYTSQLTTGPFPVTQSVILQVSDGCNTAVTATITIVLLNEPPKLNRLPAQKSVLETATTASSLYRFSPSDATTGEVIACSVTSVLPSISIFSLSPTSVTESGNIDILQALNPGYSFNSATYYDLSISCTANGATIKSNFQVDVVKNQPPYFSTGSGYVPAHASVDRSSGATVYTFDYGDSDSSSLTASCSCASLPLASCPFTCTSAGTNKQQVTTNAVLSAPGYDLTIVLTDTINTITRTLSISTSGRPYTFNADPVFVNLPQTLYVMENTPIGTSLFKVMYTDANPSDIFTLSQVVQSGTNQAENLFEFNATSGIITTKASIDFEATGAGGTSDWTIVVTLHDGTEPQHTVTLTETITFYIENVNEGINISIGQKALTADETTAATVIGIAKMNEDPTISAVDIDTGDTTYFSMDCGDDSKYFYLNLADLKVYFAREYDMDAGLPGNATCNVTVRDTKGMSDSDLITITISNINDNSPKFPYNKYVFFVLTTTTFFTEIANMSATDADIGSFGTEGGITYTFDPSDPTKAATTEEYFQIDAAGILYVRNLTAYTESFYVFEIAASDSGGMQGTCTVTVVFSSFATTTTTTTERTLTFTDDYQNYFWLLLIGLVVVITIVVIGLMVWFDPVVHEFMSFKLLRLDEWCRKKPKPKQPRRTVGKLTVTVNKKQLENDPDNALPWELLARDAEVPEINEVQERIETRKEKRDREYKNFAGLPVFEKGKGGRPDSEMATGSSSNSVDRPESDSPKYATFRPPPDDISEVGDDDDPWGDPSERRVVVTPVKPFQETDN